MTRTAPVTSKLRCPTSSRLSGSRRGASATAARPIGTLTKSTHSQPAHCVSMPPSRTPAAPPEPATAPQTPSALLRSAPSLNIVVTSDSAAGEMSAAPRPCAARAAMSQTSLWARPPSEGRGREEDQAGHEQAPPAEQVGQPAAEQEEAAEGQRVGVDDPGQVVLAEVQRAADRGQRDVDDRGVEDDDELRHRQEREGEALRAGLLLRGHRGGAPVGRSGRGFTVPVA